MSSVKSKYNTNQVNIVAHSMGRLDAIQYIEEQHSKKSLFKVDKLVTLGTPVFGSCIKSPSTLGPLTILDSWLKKSACIKRFSLRLFCNSKINK